MNQNIPMLSGAIAPTNVGALLKPYQANPLQQILESAAAFPQMQRDAQSEKLKLQQQEAQTEQTRIQTDAMKQQSAQQNFDYIGKLLIAHPEWAKTPPPGLSDKVHEYADTLGIPTPVGADGAINTDIWKTPWAAAAGQNKGLLDYIMGIPAGPQRDAALAQYSGVPDALHTTTQYVSPKEQAELQRSQAYSTHEGNLDAATKQRLNIQAYLAQHTGQVDDARVQLYQSQAQAATTNAAAHLQEASAATTNAATRGNELELKIKQFEQAPTLQSQRLAGQAASTVAQEVRSLNAQITSTEHNRDLAIGANASDDVVKAYNDQLYAMQQQRLKLNNTMQRANTVLDTNLGFETHIQSSSGRTATVTNVGARTATAGAPAAMVKEVPAQFRGTIRQDPASQHWYFVGADGKKQWWTP